MAWDSSKPGDSEKIRDLGTVIRPNLLSIEQGEDANVMANSNAGAWLQQYSTALIERDGRANNLDPTTESETFFTYCKQDATPLAEGYFKSPAGDVIQVTQGTRLGSDVTDIGFESLSHDKGTTSYNENNFITAWGAFDQDGATIEAHGMSCSAPSSGDYTITLSPSLDSATDYGIIVTPGFPSPDVNMFETKYHTKLAGSFKIRFRNGAGGSTKAPFTVMVLGGR